MKYPEILNNLKSSLTVRYHEKSVYQRKVADALGMGVPMVKRRLSGRVPFSLEQISVLCEELGIPANEIFYDCERAQKHPLEFMQYDFTSHEEESNQAFDQSIDMFVYAAQSPVSKFYVTCNTLPNILNPSFSWLARFAALQWIYFTKGSGAMLPLSDIPLGPQLLDRFDKYLMAVRALTKSVCLVNSKIVENYLTDIIRFYLLKYITKEEVGRLVLDIEGVLQLFEKVCTEVHLENGKEMEIYCSDSFFSNDMYIVESDNINFSVLQPNPVSPIISRSPDIFAAMMQWFNFWRHSSTLISQTGEHIRLQFMQKQYVALEDFKSYIGL